MASFADGPDGVTIVSPAAGAACDSAALYRWCKENAQELRRRVYAKGGVLLRGWDVHSSKEAEALVFDAAGFAPMEPYPPEFIRFNLRAQRLGVPPGGLTQGPLSRSAPHAQEGVMQTPHQEFGLGVFRPRLVCFFAETAPAPGTGPTGRVYLPDALKRLSPELRSLLREHGWWVREAGVTQPCLLSHPETECECLQLYCFSRTLSAIAHQAYLDVRASERPDLPYVESIPYDGPQNFPITLVPPEGGRGFELPREQAVEFYRAIFSTTSLHFWQDSDILLFDNMLYGHMRFPGPPPRKLHAIFADEIDTRDRAPADAPKCVRDAALAPAPGSVELVLAQVGAGGCVWLLRMLECLPDCLFVPAGRLFWVHGGGYATKNRRAGRKRASTADEVGERLAPAQQEENDQAELLPTRSKAR
jgi:hypothetical protein